MVALGAARLQLLLLLHVAVCFEDDELSDHTLGEGVPGGGGGPHFLHKELSVNISVQLGSTAHLHCRVSGLRDKDEVSWHKRTRDGIQLITVGFQTYHNDDRFSLKYEHPHDYRLRIRYVQNRDEGAYECQVPTHPPLIRTIHLHVVVPAIRILDDRDVALQEKFYRTGSTIQLQCEVADVPTATSLQLAWYHGDQRINYDASRGGVSVKTELRGTKVRSWLLVNNAVKEDSGTYFCNITDLTSTGVNILVGPEEHPAAIQGGVAVASWRPLTLAATLTSLLVLPLVCWPCR